MLWPEYYHRLRERLPTGAAREGDEVTDLYKLYDRDGKLLYVGISRDFLRRMGEHRKGKDWWRKVRRIDVSCYSSRAMALFWEYVTIQTKRPAHNIYGRALSPLRYPEAAAFVAAVHALQTLPDPEDMEWPTDPDEIAAMDKTINALVELLPGWAGAWRWALEMSGKAPRP